MKNSDWTPEIKALMDIEYRLTCAYMEDKTSDNWKALCQARELLVHINNLIEKANDLTSPLENSETRFNLDKLITF